MLKSSATRPLHREEFQKLLQEGFSAFYGERPIDPRRMTPWLLGGFILFALLDLRRLGSIRGLTLGLGVGVLLAEWREQRVRSWLYGARRVEITPDGMRWTRWMWRKEIEIYWEDLRFVCRMPRLGLMEWTFETHEKIRTIWNLAGFAHDDALLIEMLVQYYCGIDQIRYEGRHFPLTAEQRSD